MRLRRAKDGARTGRLRGEDPLLQRVRALTGKGDDWIAQWAEILLSARRRICVLSASEVLKPGGSFLAKTFQSGADADLMAQLKRDYASVRHVKPAASRQDSSERYVLVMGFRGGEQADLL